MLVRTIYILVGIKLMSASFSTSDAKFCERFRMAVTVIPSVKKIPRKISNYFKEKRPGLKCGNYLRQPFSAWFPIRLTVVWCCEVFFWLQHCCCRRCPQMLTRSYLPGATQQYRRFPTIRMLSMDLQDGTNKNTQTYTHTQEERHHTIEMEEREKCVKEWKSLKTCSLKFGRKIIKLCLKYKQETKYNSNSFFVPK